MSVLAQDGALFADRRDAGRRLARGVAALALVDPIVLALPRGGVPVADEVARALAAPLDLMLVRKIGAPGHPEYGIGAVADGSDPQTVINPEAMAVFHPASKYVQAESARQLEELERRRRVYLGTRRPPDLAGHSVVLVDDGIATGGTAKVALIALRRVGPASIVLAVPVAPQSALDDLGPFADRIVCLATPTPFHAVGLHYASFPQLHDEEVIDILQRSRRDETRPITPPPQAGAAR